MNSITFHGVDAVVVEAARALPGGGSVRSLYVVTADGQRVEIILHGAAGPVAVVQGGHNTALDLSVDNARRYAEADRANRNPAAVA